MTMDSGLQAHLETGVTTLCRCWRVTRRDGVVYGFTDHDAPLGFDGTTFSANDGMSARAFDQSTGLSIDNSEAIGILSDAGIREADILAGRFDGALVEAWLVNWKTPSQRTMLFRGEMGEIERAGGAFKAELRGLTEALNQPQGQVYQSSCAAILGDRACRVDLSDRRYCREAEIGQISGALIETAQALEDLPGGWFERGQLVVLAGAASGATQIVKTDRVAAGCRSIELWDALPQDVARGERVGSSRAAISGSKPVVASSVMSPIFAAFPTSGR